MSIKNPARLLALSVWLLFVFHSMAQPPGYRAAVNKAVSNFDMQMHMHQNMMRVLNRRNSSDVLINNKHEFTVRLKDSSEITLRSVIYYDSTADRSYVMLENKALPKDAVNRYKKILPSETLGISRYDRNSMTTVQGVPTDSCWLFKVETGTISIYSFLSEVDITDDYINALQLGDGPIEPFTPERLKEMVKEDEKALKAVEKKNYYKAIRKFNGE